jgi:hypothetical protein
MDASDLLRTIEGQIFAHVPATGRAVSRVQNLAMARTVSDRQSQGPVLQPVEPTILARLKHHTFSKIQATTAAGSDTPRKSNRCSLHFSA